MAFELIVAAKRDPVEKAEALQRGEPIRDAQPLPVATIDVTGNFCEQSASELAQSVQNVLHKPADTVIVRFRQIACEDQQSLRNFARWIEELRRNGHDVRVAVGEPDLRALLGESDISSDAVMHPTDADAVAGRRVIEVHR